MTHVPLKKQTTGGRGLRPVDGYIMYTDIDFEYNSQLSTTFNLTVDKPKILTHDRRKISTAGPIHIYSKVLFHGTVQLEVTFE